MARDGYRIFDSDTHVGPDAAILEPYLSAADKERLARWAPYRATGRSGRVTYTKGERHYRRKLGTAAPETASAGYMAGFTGVARERQPSPHVDAEPAARIADMDYEGVDVNLILPSGCTLSRLCRPMRQAGRTLGTICGCSVRRRIPGAACETWHP